MKYEKTGKQNKINKQALLIKLIVSSSTHTVVCGVVSSTTHNGEWVFSPLLQINKIFLNLIL